MYRFRCALLLVVIGALCTACGSGTGRPVGPPIPVGDTIRTIKGQIAYFTTGPRLSDFDANGRLLVQPGFVKPTFPRPAPRFPVEILSPTGTVLGQGITDTDGDYSVEVNFGQNSATQVAVRVRAQLDLPFGTVVRVRANALTTEPYSHQTALSGNPADEVMTIDLTIALDDGAGAYFILEGVYDGLVLAKAGLLGAMPDLDIFWEPGNTDRSSLVVEPERASLTVAGGLAGDAASNQDVWDAPKVMRLLGEYVLAYFINDVAPEGEPNGALLVPSAAWREGFLDFWACIGRNSQLYWDTEGIDDDGRVVRYFDLESFFDPALGSLGPDDPNVYQAASTVGIGSPYSIAELLWDIHDPEGGFDPGDEDGVEFPLYLSLRFLERLNTGTSYPYIYSLLDAYAFDGALSSVTLDILVRIPEDQGLEYPAADGVGLVWPTPIVDPGATEDLIVPPFDESLQDMVDTLNPDPVNFEIGLFSQRYFRFNLGMTATATASLDTQGDLAVDILRPDNALLASGSSSATTLLDPGRYVVRVRSANNPQLAPFTLRLQLQ